MTIFKIRNPTLRFLAGLGLLAVLTVGVPYGLGSLLARFDPFGYAATLLIAKSHFVATWVLGVVGVGFLSALTIISVGAAGVAYALGNKFFDS